MVERLIVGLGNPGPRYLATRHNVGFEVARAFARRHRVGLGAHRFGGEYGADRVDDRDVGVLLPATFMNASGAAVRAALDALPQVDPEVGLLVVYDDLDLDPGRIRLRARGGAGGHRGMASVIDAVGSPRIPRLRFGVGRPPVGQDPRAYLLETMDEADRARLSDRYPLAVDAIDAFLVAGIGTAMDRFNAEPGPPGSD